MLREEEYKQTNEFQKSSCFVTTKMFKINNKKTAITSQTRL